MNAVYSSEVMYEMGQIQNEINAIAPGLNNLDTVRDKDKGAKVIAVIRTHKVANNTVYYTRHNE